MLIVYIFMTVAQYGPRHVKTCLRAYADSEGPDPGHHCLLIELLASTECMIGEQRPG